MAGRSMWTGSISFGLVNIPVKLYAATRENRIAFHLLHDQDMVRLKRKMVCPADGREVHPEHVVRGYEASPGNFVVIRDEELESCAPEKARTIEITDFVDIAAIDPIYYDHPYYVLPQAGAGKSYRLLVEAMNRAKKVGIARIVFHDKEYLAALRPVGVGMCLETMRFADEIVPSEVIGVHGHHAAPERELKAAKQLIERMSERFDPEKYHDQWKRAMRKMLEQKTAHARKGKSVDETTSSDKPSKKAAGKGAKNLMAALEASLAKARSEAGIDDPDRPARRGKSSHGRGRREKVHA